MKYCTRNIVRFFVDARHTGNSTLLSRVEMYNQPFQQQVPLQGPPGGPNSQQYFPNVSPELINYGLSAGTNVLNQNADKWTAKASGFWTSLKFYFSVSVSVSWRLYSSCSCE